MTTNSKTIVFIGLASASEYQQYFCSALEQLTTHITDIECSAVFASPCIKGKPFIFHNMVIRGSTSLSPASLVKELKGIEIFCGRNHNNPEVNIDLDLLIYGELFGTHDSITLPRQEIFEQAHVVVPLSMLVDDDVSPQILKKLAIAETASPRNLKIWRAPFTWRGMLFRSAWMLANPQMKAVHLKSIGK